MIYEAYLTHCMAGEFEDIEMTERHPEYDDEYNEYNDMDEDSLKSELVRLSGPTDPETRRKFNYVRDLLGQRQGRQETSFVDNDDNGKTVTITAGNNTGFTAPRSVFVDYTRPENLPVHAVGEFIGKSSGMRSFSLHYPGEKSVELRSRISLTSRNNIEFKPISDSNERSKPQIVLKRKGKSLRYNDSEVSRKAVRQFRMLVKEAVNEQRLAGQWSDELIETTIKRDVVAGLTPEENRSLMGVLNPGDTIDPESRIGPSGALQIQADYFQEALDATIDQMNDPGTTTDEFISLADRVNALEEARDQTLEQRELEEVREQQEEDITRFQKFKEFAKENMVGLSAIAITIGGIITTIIIGMRKAIYQGGKAMGKFAKAVYNLGKKLGPLLAPLMTIVSAAISVGAKGLAWLASNLWVLAIAIAWFVYDEYLRGNKE